MATRIIKRPSIKIEVKDGKYKPFIFDNGKKCYLCNSDEPEPPTPPVPPEPTNRILYTVVEGGYKPESTWITENCSDNVFDENTGEGYLVLNEGVDTVQGEGGRPPKNIFNDGGSDSNVEGVILPAQITTIGDSAFNSCSALTSITISDSVTTIGNGAFNGCAMTSIIIPNSVTTVGNGAFGNCVSLISVTIPDSVISIGNFAFVNCPSLESVTIPDSVTIIGTGAFMDCTSLASVTCFATTPPTLGNDAFTGIDTTTCGVPEAAISAYQNDLSWSAAFTTFVAADV